MEIIDNKLIGELLAKAGASARLRQNLDLRTSGADGSQRMLNALLPGTRVPIHRHPESTENVLLLTGKLAEVFYEEERLGGVGCGGRKVRVCGPCRGLAHGGGLGAECDL